MKPSGIAAVLALASTAASNIVRVPVARGTAGTARKIHSALSKRASVTETLINNVTAGGYYATVSVGTPAQDVIMVLDTGSSDAWVVSSEARLCTEKKLQVYYGQTCGETFDASSSSTFKEAVPGGFTIQYADGSGASGDYFTDDFTIGDITVSDLQMGIADQTAIGNGILGVGFELNEAADTMYSNLVSTMVNQSKINTLAYSLYLNDYSSSTGSILFGGVDTEKFIGDLMTVPILTDAQSDNYSSLTVGLTGLSFGFANGTNYTQSLTVVDNSLKSILDSGTTLSYLPDAIAISIFDAVGAYQDTSAFYSTGLALVDCNLDVELTFTVNGNATITVPKDELVSNSLQGITLDSAVPFTSPCLFGIQSMGDSSGGTTGGSTRTADYALLGDSLLRSAYVVYDLEHLQIGLAPANLNSTTTNVQELKAGEASLPAFSGVASQAASSSSSTSTSTASTTHTATGSGSASGEGTLLSSTSTSYAPTTSVDASVFETSCIPPSAALGLGTTSSSTWMGLNASSVVVTAAYSTASAASSSSGSRVYGVSNATAHITTTLRGSVSSAAVSSTVSASHTNFSTASASSTRESAAMGLGPSDLREFLGVVGISTLFIMSGGMFFWV